MMTYTSISEPKIRYLYQILDHIEKGKLFVPKFQRGFVWKDEQRLDLLHSIKFSLPIGSLLVWETTQYDLLTYDKLGGLPVPSIPQPTPGIPRTYLLDGHQRLSTLFGTLKRPAHAPQKDEEERDWGIFYDLKEESFLFLPRCSPPQATWMPVSVLLDSLALLKFLRTLKNEEFVERADQLSKTFLEYKIVLVSIETDDLEQATLAFKRINSSGTKMGDVDMVAALSWSREFDLREKMEKVREKLSEVGWEFLEDKFILAACKTRLKISIFDAQIDETSKAIKAHPEIIDEVTNDFMKLAQLLSNSFKIHSPELVPYSYYQVILLVEAIHQLNFTEHPEAIERLSKWFWYTSYTEELNHSVKRSWQSELEKVLSLARNEEISFKKTNIDPLPKKFYFTSVRAKLFVLRLAELKPQNYDGRILEGGKLLAHHGRHTILRLICDKSIPENCFVVEPSSSSKFRNYLLKQTDWNKNFLDSHAISPTAVSALKQGDYDKFLEERRKTLVEIEKAFIQPLGLDYESEDI